MDNQQSAVAEEPLTKGYDWPDPPTLEQLAAMNDAQLAKALGMDQKVEQARKALAEAANLTGKAKEYAEDRIKRMFSPPDYALSDLSYVVEDAKRTAKRSAKEELETEPSPGSVL